MRIEIKTVKGDRVEGILASKDETFVMIKIGKDKIVRVFHWVHIAKIFRISKGTKNEINLDTFRKIRE